MRTRTQTNSLKREGGWREKVGEVKCCWRGWNGLYIKRWKHTCVECSIIMKKREIMFWIVANYEHWSVGSSLS